MCETFLRLPGAEEAEGGSNFPKPFLAIAEQDLPDGHKFHRHAQSIPQGGSYEASLEVLQRH
jgi:hypothetical protein